LVPIIGHSLTLPLMEQSPDEPLKAQLLRVVPRPARGATASLN
jgi:hypothetical protein